jgi:hypothetical protein
MLKTQLQKASHYGKPKLNSSFIKLKLNHTRIMINKFIINFYKDRYFNSKAYVSTAA